jgi:hypothetical protein
MYKLQSMSAGVQSYGGHSMAKSQMSTWGMLVYPVPLWLGCVGMFLEICMDQQYICTLVS